jgi:hypothetical protein
MNRLQQLSCNTSQASIEPLIPIVGSGRHLGVKFGDIGRHLPPLAHMITVNTASAFLDLEYPVDWRT